MPTQQQYLFPERNNSRQVSTHLIYATELVQKNYKYVYVSEKIITFFFNARTLVEFSLKERTY